MITLDAFLVFLATASLPVIYIWLVSRWVEVEYRETYGEPAPANPPTHQAKLIAKAA